MSERVRPPLLGANKWPPPLPEYSSHPGGPLPGRRRQMKAYDDHDDVDDGVGGGDDDDLRLYLATSFIFGPLRKIARRRSTSAQDKKWGPGGFVGFVRAARARSPPPPAR